eukprot:Pgem_evm1s15856
MKAPLLTCNHCFNSKAKMASIFPSARGAIANNLYNLITKVNTRAYSAISFASSRSSNSSSLCKGQFDWNEKLKININRKLHYLCNNTRQTYHSLGQSVFNQKSMGQGSKQGDVTTRLLRDPYFCDLHTLFVIKNLNNNKMRKKGGRDRKSSNFENDYYYRIHHSNHGASFNSRNFIETSYRNNHSYSNGIYNMHLVKSFQFLKQKIAALQTVNTSDLFTESKIKLLTKRWLSEYFAQTQNSYQVYKKNAYFIETRSIQSSSTTKIITDPRPKATTQFLSTKPRIMKVKKTSTPKIVHISLRRKLAKMNTLKIKKHNNLDQLKKLRETKNSSTGNTESVSSLTPKSTTISTTKLTPTSTITIAKNTKHKDTNTQIPTRISTPMSTLSPSYPIENLTESNLTTAVTAVTPTEAAIEQITAATTTEPISTATLIEPKITTTITEPTTISPIENSTESNLTTAVTPVTPAGAAAALEAIAIEKITTATTTEPIVTATLIEPKIATTIIKPTTIAMEQITTVAKPITSIVEPIASTIKPILTTAKLAASTTTEPITTTAADLITATTADPVTTTTTTEPTTTIEPITTTTNTAMGPITTKSRSTAPETSIPKITPTYATTSSTESLSLTRIAVTAKSASRSSKQHNPFQNEYTEVKSKVLYFRQCIDDLNLPQPNKVLVKIAFSKKESIFFLKAMGKLVNLKFFLKNTVNQDLT